jgi:DNA polymerase-3 subunit delta'
MAPRPSILKRGERAPEADRFQAVPHPRERFDLFGHEAIETELLNIYRSGRLPHALLIGGPSGIGKATLAWRLARFLLVNPNPTSELCRAASNFFVPEDDDVARQIISLAHPDLFLLRREWNEKTGKLSTEIKIDDIRKMIRLFQQAPGRNGYRIAILDSAEDLNLAGANALLKLIEEPPPRSLFVIVAHRPGQVLPTIRSRCHKIMLKPLSGGDILRAIESMGPALAEISEAEKNAACARAGGSVHDALRLLSGHSLAIDARLQSVLHRLPRIDWDQVHALADDVAQSQDAAEYDLILAAVFDWLDARVRLGALSGQAARPAALAVFAMAWEKVAARVRETEALNLDKRGLILSAFTDLAEAAALSV